MQPTLERQNGQHVVDCGGKGRVAIVISRLFWQYSDPCLSPYFGPVSDLQTHFRPIPTCLLFLHFRSLSGPSPRWHHLYDDYTVQYQLHRSPEASEHPLLSSTSTSGIPTSASVLPCVTSYFRLINSHDHYISHPSCFCAATSQC